MCDYPDCNEAGMFLEYEGSISIWLCDKHKKLADFVRKIINFKPNPW